MTPHSAVLLGKTTFVPPAASPVASFLPAVYPVAICKPHGASAAAAPGAVRTAG